MRYTREYWAICDIGWADFERNLGPEIEGNKTKFYSKLRLLYENIRRLFLYLDKDEAMLFVVSQLCSQAGIPGAIQEVLTFKTKLDKQKNQFFFPFYYKGLFLRLTHARGTKNEIIRIMKGIYLIQTEQEWYPGAMIQVAKTMPCGFGGLEFIESKNNPGLQSIRIVTTVILERVQNSISMQLSDFTCRVYVK